MGYYSTCYATKEVYGTNSRFKHLPLARTEKFFFQKQSSATRPLRRISSRSSIESVLLLVGFKTTAEEGICLMFGRPCTSRDFLSLAEVHFLGSSCRNS